MLDKRNSIAQFCDWIKGVVQIHVANKSDSHTFKTVARRFLLVWTNLGARVLKALKHIKTANSSSKKSHSKATLFNGFYIFSFIFKITGSFHLIQLLLNEFILHEIERMVLEESIKELMLNMVHSQPTELPDISFMDSLGPDFLSNPNLIQTHYDDEEEEDAENNEEDVRMNRDQSNAKGTALLPFWEKIHYTEKRLRLAVTV